MCGTQKISASDERERYEWHAFHGGSLVIVVVVRLVRRFDFCVGRETSPTSQNAELNAPNAERTKFQHNACTGDTLAALAADTATIVLIAAFQSLISRNKMTVLQLAVLLLSHFVILAAGFAPQSVVDVASSSSTELQAKRLPITMPTQTPMVPYRVSFDNGCDRRGCYWLFGSSWLYYSASFLHENTCATFRFLPECFDE